MDYYFDFQFVFFLILSILSFIINLIFYIYKKKGYSLHKLKPFLFILFIASALCFIVGLPFFVLNDSRAITNSFEYYLAPIILFNLSIFLLGISIIFFLIPFLETDNSIVNLDIPPYLTSRKGTIKLGRILKGKTKKYKFYLSIKDLEKHMFICGATGTGKSNFLKNFLINFTRHYKIPFFLVEFKGEYHFLQKKIDDVLILWPGENFAINIFNPEDSNHIIHAERIFDILKSGQFLEISSAEYSPQMEKVLVEILVKVCKKNSLRNWGGFEQCCEEYLREHLNDIPMLSQTLISIKNRIRRFSKGPLRALFNTNNEIEVKKLFKNNIILDLSSIIRLGGEKEDAFFFLNMMLKYLWDKNLTQGAINYDGIKHITIVEDAQYFAPQDLIKKSKITTYLEDIALLQRGTGECLITLATRPDISKEILANNGVVLTFKNHIEKDLMCELLNLDLENKSYLSILEEGQCIVRINSIKEPFLLKVPYIKRESQKLSEINRRNKLILNKWQKFFNSKKNMKKIKKKRKNFRNFKQFTKSISNLRKKEVLRLRRGINLLRKREDNKNLKLNSYNNLENENKESYREEFPKKELKYESKKSIKIREKNRREKNCVNSFPFREENKNIKFQQFNRNKLKLDEILIKYIKIENLYKTNSFNELIVSCVDIIDIILEKISLQLGIKFKDVDQFLKSLVKLKLDRNFILYSELVEFREFLRNNKEKIELFKPEIAVSIFSITKRIINKLKTNWTKKKKNNYSTAYDKLERKPLIVDDFYQDDKLLKKNIKVSNQNSNSDPEQNEFAKLKSYVNELFNEQKKNK